MKFHNRTPIYQQIMEYISSHIVIGNWKTGQRIPSVREMSAQIMVNASTVQRAYQELEETGLIYNERGVGKFVTTSHDIITEYRNMIIQQKVRDFLHSMYELNLSKVEITRFIEEEISKEGSNYDSSH